MKQQSKRRVVIVDDEQAVSKTLARMVERLGFSTVTAGSGQEGLACIGPDTDLVLLDVQMPDMCGFDVAKALRARPDVRDIPILMVTSLEGRRDRLRAVEAGANDFVAKPVEFTELQVRVNAVLALRDAQEEVRRKNEWLATEVETRTYELTDALDQMEAARDHLESAQLETLHRLAVASEFKDQYSTMHIRRVGRYCALVARTLGFAEANVQLLLRASPLHDVGKLGIPDAILLKPGRLTEQERRVVERHTTIGAEILKGSSSEILKAAESIALNHHEHYDGRGYPHRLVGAEIPIFARICAVADVYDALTSRRPYKEPFSVEKTTAILEEGRGSQFDPRVLDAFLARLSDVQAVQAALRDRHTFKEINAIPLPRLAGGTGAKPQPNSGVS